VTRKWLNSQDVEVDAASGALLVELLTDSSGALLVKLLSDAAASPGTLSASGLCTPVAAGTPMQLIPAWATATVYAPGNVRLDTDSTTWVCLVAHTSGTGTFGADRVAQPTYWQQIVSSKFVWIGAPVSAMGVALNQQPVFIGAFNIANEPNIPITVANFEGMPVFISDPSKIFVQSGHVGDGVVFRIFA
jgi:hypothetical protein